MFINTAIIMLIFKDQVFKIIIKLLYTIILNLK